MNYKLKEVVAEFTKGNYASDCLKYNADDLLEMFDEANVTKNALGDFEDFTVNDCIEHDLLTKDLVVTSECDDMFCYVRDNSEIDISCSADFDYEAYYSCS
mgnify:CR=1 FL=1|tara:strand:- start:572 stop:874 length:303 start_codon:yes stop_codon:yes gene_type:complete